MKKNSIGVLVIVLGMLYVPWALAAESQQGGNLPAAESKSSAIMNMQKASELIGKKVQSSNGLEVGKIKDLVIDAPSHTVAYAVIDYKDRLYLVPIGAVTAHPNVNLATLNVDKNKFVLAPNFPKDRWPDLTNARFNSDIHAYYGVAPSWGGPAETREQAPAPGTTDQMEQRPVPGSHGM